MERAKLFHLTECAFILTVDVAQPAPRQGSPSTLFELEGNDVTKNKSTSSLCLALLIVSPFVGAEVQYPAANFEPVIISQDADLIAKHSQAAKERAQAKPQPAQSNQQHQNRTQQTPTGQAKADTGSNPEKALSKQEESAMENFPIVLIILFLAGFVFWSTKRSASKATTPANVVVSAPAALVSRNTGVGRYLSAIETAARKAAGTGVDQYLRKLASSAPVPTPAAAPSSPAETGVARYLRTKQS